MLRTTCRPPTSLLRYAFLILLLTLTACSKHENFSQRAGFAEFFKAHPRSDAIPAPEDRELLDRYRPRLWVDANAEGPIDFYQDYIGSGELRGPDDQLISDQVDQRLLNEYKGSPQVVFSHRHSADKATPVAYGRADRGVIEGLGEITALTWHFVFRFSGIPDGISAIKRAALNLIGDTLDWHQLDHYTAATLVLDPKQRPLALLLQQHNYQRSYIFGCDLDWPTDNRIRVVSAAGSNELYPYKEGEHRQRSVPFMSEKGARYLILGESPPLMSADDITRTDREVDYQIEWLPPSDAFYSFEGYLGEKRRLPGREGPPGADYNTLPPLQRIETQIVLYNWNEGDREFIDRYTEMRERIWNEPTVDTASLPAFDSLRQRFVQRAKECQRPVSTQ